MSYKTGLSPKMGIREAVTGSSHSGHRVIIISIDDTPSGFAAAVCLAAVRRRLSEEDANGAFSFWNLNARQSNFRAILKIILRGNCGVN
jgi:hypothetical protein